MNSQKRSSIYPAADLSPTALRLVKACVNRLIRRSVFLESVRDDLYQELCLHLLRQMKSYSPTKASESTFIRRILRNRALQLKIAQCRECRDARRTVSLEGELAGEPFTLKASDLIDHKTSSVSADVELRLDIETTLRSLPVKLQKLCHCLKSMSWESAARKLRIPKRHIVTYREQLQSIFARAGLGPQQIADA